MSANVINQVAFLKTSREFPEEIKELTVQINKTYVDIANAVNNRTIGLFSVNRPAITGESWFFNGVPRQQTLRQVYEITSTASFNHGLDTTAISTFTKITGIGYDGTNWFPIPYLSTNPAFSLGIFVTPTQVILDPGASRTLVSGFVLLEWLSNV